MKLNTKIPIILVLICLSIVAINYGILNKLVLQSFSFLETQEALKRGAKLNEQINSELSFLYRKTGDWAYWDDSYNFVTEPNETFIKDNIGDSTLEQLGINVLIYINSSGKIVFNKSYDLQNNVEIPPSPWWEQTPLPLDYSSTLDASKDLVGVVMVEDKPMLVSSRQIVHTNGDGPASGFVIFGKYVDKDVINDIAQAEKVPVELLSFTQFSTSEEYKTAQIELKKSQIYTHAENNDTTEAYILINDIHDNPAFVLRESLTRDIYKYGQNSAQLFTLFITGMVIFAAVFMYLFLYLTVIRRLALLTFEVRRIGTSSSLSDRVSGYGSDELGELANSFNKTLVNLEQLTDEKVYQESQSQSLLSVMDEAVILTNEEDKIVFTNPACGKFFGYDSKEMLENRISDLLKFSDLRDKLLSSNILENIPKSSEQSRRLTVKVEGKNKKLAVLITFARIKVNKFPQGIIYVFHDVTSDVELNQQKDDFFSIASHELRTPLTVISGNLDNILQGYGKSQITDIDKKSLNDALSSSDRLTRLVNDYLNVSRLDQGRVMLNPKPVNMCTMIKSIQQEMTPLFNTKHIQFSFECLQAHPEVLADEDKLKEVLINLIGNSVKFSENGAIKVIHEVKENKLFTYVEDTGIGIAKDKQHLLFARFQQAMDKTLVRQAQGTGLGLYISREFIRLLGGELWLERSEPGKGSVFAFTLPFVKV